MTGRFLRLGIAGLAAAAMLMSIPAAEAADMRAAKKEGKILWYSSLLLSTSQKVCKAFNDRKLGIQCILHRDGSGKLYRRYRTEARGKLFKADVIHTSNIGHFIIMNDKLKFIRPYKPKGADRFVEDFKTKDNRWTIFRASVMVPLYNTKLVKAEDVPTSWLDFLKPKWKKKLVVADPNYGGFATATMIALSNMFGDDYYIKLRNNKPRTFDSAGATGVLVARGEVLMTTGTVAYGAFDLIKKGEPVKMVIPKEGVPFVASPASVLAKAPHPNAAEVFMDHLFSKDTQQLLADNGLYVGHPDVKYPKAQTPLSALKLLKVDPQEMKKRSKPIRKKFTKIFRGILTEGKKATKKRAKAARKGKN